MKRINYTKNQKRRIIGIIIMLVIFIYLGLTAAHYVVYLNNSGTLKEAKALYERSSEEYVDEIEQDINNITDEFGNYIIDLF